MFPQIDLSRVTTHPVSERKNKVTVASFARVFDPEEGGFAVFIESLPTVLKVGDLRALVASIVAARRNARPVVWMMGAHVVKTGLSPLVIDLMERRVLTAVAMNSAAAVHDVETALYGATSEEVAENLAEGTFGMWKETGDFINGALVEAFAHEPFG
ncbi:MAG: hypothetical protein QHI48_12590, partial [Bacteroidota bacterium]|nr:hypothetical protein [Bacteroidota bacterium]